jgi:hypothetical protein
MKLIVARKMPVAFEGFYRDLRAASNMGLDVYEACGLDGPEWHHHKWGYSDEDSGPIDDRA